MNVLAFIEQWANPVGYVRVYTEADYIVATSPLNQGISWTTFIQQVVAQYTFNSQAKEWFMFLPKEVQKAKVTHFAVTDNKELILFTNLKKNSK